MKNITVKDFENKTLLEICDLLDGKPVPKEIILFTKTKGKIK